MSLWGTSAQPKVPRTSYSSYTYVCSELQQQLKNSLFQGGVEKTNKSELRNRLTYRVLIYIFEVRIKTFFLKWEISRSKSQFEIFFFEKTALFFLRLEAKFFMSPCYHARHLQQIHCFKIFCRMYGLIVMLTIPTSKVHLSILILIDIFNKICIQF